MSNQAEKWGAALSFVIVWGFFLALIVGYIMNIFEVISLVQSGGDLTAMGILRVVGLGVGPLGGVMGYF